MNDNDYRLARVALRWIGGIVITLIAGGALDLAAYLTH